MKMRLRKPPKLNVPNTLTQRIMSFVTVLRGKNGKGCMQFRGSFGGEPEDGNQHALKRQDQTRSDKSLQAAN